MKTYNQFINESQMNEGLFDVFKKMFGKIGQYINKSKGGKEVEAIYKKYVALINKEFEKQGITDLALGDTTQTLATTSPLTAADTATTVRPTTESIITKYSIFLNEAVGEETDVLNKEEKEAQVETSNKLTPQKLKQKLVILQQIIEKLKQKALVEMEAVMKKYGGDEKNPKLRVIINNKKEQFILDFLNSQVKFLEAAGDKTMIAKVKADRDKLSKDLNNKWLHFDDAGNIAEGGALAMSKYYPYKTPTGIKTIKTVQASPNQGKVTATYVYDQDGQIKNQDFTISNIDITTEYEIGKKYNYYSESNNDVISVTVKSFDKEKNTIVLESEKGNEFNGNVGAMRDEVKETPPAT